MSHITCLNDITNVFYINLDYREDRKLHVEEQLCNIGLNGTRFKAIKMSNGAIGCSMSHLKIIQNAIKNELDHIMIVEDDITFLEPDLFKHQINKFFELHKNKWDVILLAGNNFPPYQIIDETCIKVSRCQTTTGYLVNGHYLKVLEKNIKIGLTHLLNNPFERNKYAIDKFWFILQNASNWYLITPPTVIQREDYSDIEEKVVSYKRMMQDLNKY